jgi:hypothetical protein
VYVYSKPSLVVWRVAVCKSLDCFFSAVFGIRCRHCQATATPDGAMQRCCILVSNANFRGYSRTVAICMECKATSS